VESSTGALVFEVDQRIRDIMGKRRLERGRSPLDPQLWVAASRDVAAQVGGYWRNISEHRSGGQMA
jgi:hypothetical protein